MRLSRHCINHILIGALGSALIACSVFSVLYAAAPPFTLTISAEHDTVKTGADIWIKIVLTNSSDQTIYVSRGPAECEYQVSVWDAPDHMALLTEYGAQVKNWNVPTATGFVSRGGKLFLPPCMTANHSKGSVDPGEESDHHSGLMISDLYDMRRPGRYTIQLQRDIESKLYNGEPIEGPSIGVAKSNIITLIVTP